MTSQISYRIIFIVRNTLGKIILVNVLKRNTPKAFHKMHGELRLLNKAVAGIYTIETTKAVSYV